MTQTAWVLSLTQFYLSLGFMLFFLALELGLAWVLLGFRLRAHRGGAALLAYRFWARVFALSLIVSFAASLPLLLQLGTLWPRFMDRAGEVAGPLVALAVLTAFIFKSCFLGAMLYGQRTLSNVAHTLVVAMVALGTSLTAYWVVVLLGWLQWPVGATLFEGHYRVADWLDVLGGLAPLLFGVLLTGGLLVAAAFMVAVTAARTRARPSDAGDRRVYGAGLWLVLTALVLQAVLATLLASELLSQQPARAAATIPQWTSGAPERLTLLGWLDVAGHRSDWATYAAQAPDWLPRAADGSVRGLSDMMGMRPPIWPTFALPRLAVLLAAGLALMALWSLRRGWRLHYEPDHLTPAGRLGLRLMLWLAVGSQAAAWGYWLIGSLPYAIHGTVTLREITTTQDEEVLWGGLVLQVAVYAALTIGFYRLVRHVTRYGVVPVARHRGRA